MTIESIDLVFKSIVAEDNVIIEGHAEARPEQIVLNFSPFMPYMQHCPKCVSPRQCEAMLC